MTPAILLALAITPGAADYGDVEVGSFAHLGFRQPGAFTVKNDTATTEVIDRVTLTGDVGFEVIGPDLSVLPPGATARIDGIFRPVALGPANAQYIVFADGGTVPVAQLAVTANGIAPRPDDDSCSAGGSPGGVALPLGVALLILRRRFRDRNAAPRP